MGDSIKMVLLRRLISNHVKIRKVYQVGFLLCGLYLLHLFRYTIRQPKIVIANQLIYECAPRRHLYFLKVPNSGSTTTANMFWRFGMRHNLSFMTYNAAFPPDRDDISYQRQQDPENYPGFDGKYDIFASHSYFGKNNEHIIQRDMHDDVAKISLIREPLAQLRSTLRDRSALRYPNAADPVGELLMDTPYHQFMIRKILTGTKFVPAYYGLTDTEDDGFYGPTIDNIDAKFELVMLLEYMDESLILLKRKLCWSLQDVLYVPLRFRSYEHKTIVNKTLVELYRALNPFYYELYDHFEHKLQGLIYAEGQAFVEEVTYFRTMLDKTKTFCDDICHKLKSAAESNFTDTLKEQMEFPASSWGEAFVLDGYECAKMMMHPVHMDRAAIRRQHPGHCAAEKDRTASCEEWPHSFIQALASQQKLLFSC